MNFLVAALWGGFLQIAGSMIGRILLALGIGFVTYTGFTATIDWLLVAIKSNMSAMPADTVAFLAWLWVDKAIAVLFSAYAAALLVKMAGSTTISKMVTK
jgi:hypothetical protein